MRKLVNRIFLFFAFAVFFCGLAKAEYIDKEEVLRIDSYDHEECINKVNMLNADALELYWSCRVNLINDYISKTKNSPEFGLDYKKELQSIKKVILYRKEEALDKVYQERYNKRYVQTVFLEDKDWYYFDLINEKFSTEIVYVQQLREIKNERQKSDDAKRQERLKRESVCYKYKSDAKAYNRCLESLRLSSVCLDTLEESVLEKELEYRFNCKKEANEKYPDALVFYNNEYEKLNNMSKQDKYVVDRDNEKKIINKKKELDKSISGPKLSKSQILELRKTEERNCLVDKVRNLGLFRDLLIEQCEKIKEDIK